MDHTFNPGGGPEQMLPPQEVPGTPGQGPIIGFGRDGTRPNIDSAMLFTVGSRRRVRGDQAEADSGPV
jgi:hypothetical protein